MYPQLVERGGTRAASRFTRTDAVRAAISVVLLVGAACTTGGGDGQSGSPSAGGGEQSARVVETGVLRLPVTAEVVVDPLAVVASDPAAMLTLDVLYDGLTSFPGGLVERDGQWVQPDEPVMNLARAMEPSADNRVWTIQLADRTFSDGSPIRAADVKASLEYLARPGPSSLAGTRLSIVQGSPEFVGRTADELTGVRVVDDQTLELTLSEPYPDLPALFASPLFGVLPARVVDTGFFLWDRMTSGSYEVVEVSDDRRQLRLARRAGVQDGPDLIEFHAFDDWPAAYEAFRRGELDWSPVPTGVGAEEHDGSWLVPSNVVVWLVLPMTGAFSDPAARTALAQLIDAEQVRERAFADSRALLGLVPVGLAGDRVDQSDVCGALCNPNPSAGAAVLNQRFPSGVPEIQITALDDPTQRAVVDEVVRMLGEAGIRTNVQLLTIDEFFERADRVDAGLKLSGAVGLVPSQDDYLSTFLQNDGVVASLVDPSVGESLRSVRAVTDQRERSTRCAELEARLLAQALVLPIAQLELRHQVSERVSGWALRLDGSVAIEKVSVGEN
ncbi:MAG: ABC transporter substrate-binding protein [Acidimicrobiales bacterium]|nr:ABC transporter substrate-binding protein [Acidimicrobiales bacterium]